MLRGTHLLTCVFLPKWLWTIKFAVRVAVCRFRQNLAILGQTLTAQIHRNFARFALRTAILRIRIKRWKKWFRVRLKIWRRICKCRSNRRQIWQIRLSRRSNAGKTESKKLFRRILNLRSQNYEKSSKKNCTCFRCSNNFAVRLDCVWFVFAA